MAGKLSERQQRFIDAYLVDPNATKAALAAGYSPKTARSVGSENLTKPDIQAELAARRAKATAVAGLTLQAHLDRLNELAGQAADSEQFGPAVSAEISRGKASGFYVERREHTGPNGGPFRVVIEREGRRRKE